MFAPNAAHLRCGAPHTRSGSSGLPTAGKLPNTMRRVVVSGGNKGIGLAIVERVLAEGDDTFVYVGAREPLRGRAAIDALVAREPAWAARLAVLPLDVSSEASCAAAATAVGVPLYGFVCNAGVWGRNAHDTNVRGVKRCLDAFAPLLGPSTRVVNVSSGSAPMFVAACAPTRAAALTAPAGMSWGQVEAVADEFAAAAAAADGGDGGAALAAAGFPADPAAVASNAYGLSKALLNAYTAALAHDTPWRVNACTPGFIDTDLVRAHFEAQGKTAREAGAQPPAAGVRATAFLLFGEPAGRGWFFGSDGLRSPLDRYRSPGTPAFEG